MEILSIVPATALGYLTLRATTHPNSKLRKRFPNIKTKRFQVFPVIRVNLFGRVFHLHHWLSFSLILIMTNFLPLGFLETTFSKGMLLGGIIQGLRLPTGHRNIIYKDFSVERLTSLADKK